MAIQTFTALQVLTAAQMNALQANDYNQTVSTKTASYVLVAADKGTKLVMNAGATSTTITVNTSLFAAGDTLTILNTSTSGTCTITAGTATVASAGSLVLGLNQGGVLYFTSAGVSVFQADGVTAAAGGLTLVSTTTYSAQSTVDITAFTATYDNYKVIVQNTAGSGDLFFRLGNAGTFNATAGVYRWNIQYASYTNATITGGASTTTATGFIIGNAGFASIVEIYNPFLAVVTGFTYAHSRDDWGFMCGGGATTVTTSFSQMRLYPSSGTISGTVRIYGYQNS